MTKFNLLIKHINTYVSD